MIKRNRMTALMLAAAAIVSVMPAKAYASDKIKNIIKTQLEKSNKARFRVVLGDENKLRITSGWLFRMDLRSYSLKPLGRF